MSFILAWLFLFSSTGNAACSPVGKQRYQANLMEFCDGTSWVSMKGSSVTGCTAGESGKVRWSSSRYEFCDGANWFQMKGSSLGACAGGDVKKQRYSSSKMQFCDGANWYDMTAPAACGGASVGGYCWYLGGSFKSCDLTCGLHGGCNAAVVDSYAGLAGSDANCIAVLTALGQSANSFTDLPGGYGCGIFNAVPSRGISATATCAGADPSVLRACPCAN